jgi:hypothetical protein
MIGALGSPVAIFGVVWLFRRKLNELLPLLILKHKDWQISFGLDKAEEEAKKLLPAPPVAEGEPGADEKKRLEEANFAALQDEVSIVSHAEHAESG